MEVNVAINKINAGNITDSNTFELWEIEEALANSKDPKAVEALKVFKATISEKDLVALTKNEAQKIKANQDALNAVKREYNPLGDSKDEDVIAINNFFNNVEIENKAGTDNVTKEGFRDDLIRISSIQAAQEISLQNGFSSASREDQKKLYKVALFNCLQENAIIVVENQLLENMSQKQDGKINKESVREDAIGQLSGLLSGEKKFKISNTNVLGLLKSSVDKASSFAKLIAKKTGLAEAANAVKKQDKQLTEKYPNTWPFLKSLGKGIAVSTVAGPTGIAIMGAYYLRKTVLAQKAQAKKEELSYFKYLKKHKAQAIVLGASVAGTLLPCYSIVTSGMDAGLISRAVEGKLGATLSNMTPTFGGEIGLVDQAKNAGNAIWETMKTGTYQARAATQATAAAAMAGEEFSKAFDAKTEAERKMHMYKAKRTLLGGAMGIGLGLAMAGAAGAEHSNDSSAAVVGNGDNHVPPMVDRDGDGISDYIDRDGGDGWANDASKGADIVNTHSGDFSTTDSVQNLYEHRIYDLTTTDSVVDNMLNNIKSDMVGIPDGCSPERAIHTAEMLKMYYGDDTALDMLKGCSELSVEQQSAYFEKLLPQFNAERGDLKIGYPTDPNYGPGIDRITKIEMSADCGEKGHFVGLERTPAPVHVPNTEPVVRHVPVPSVQPEIVPVQTPIIIDEPVVLQPVEIPQQTYIHEPPLQNKPIEAPVYVPEPVDNGNSYEGHAQGVSDLDNKIGAEGRVISNPQGNFNDDYTGHAGSLEDFNAHLDASKVGAGISDAQVQQIDSEAAAFSDEFDKQLLVKGYALGEDGAYHKADTQTPVDSDTKTTPKAKLNDDLYFGHSKGGR